MSYWCAERQSAAEIGVDTSSFERMSLRIQGYRHPSDTVAARAVRMDVPGGTRLLQAASIVILWRCLVDVLYCINCC